MFKYYFNFKDLPLIGRVQISEPFGSDAQTHSVKQDDNRYGRDMILGNEETKLKIFRDNFEFIYYPQMSIDGVEFNHLSHGFDYLCSLFETIGWESEVEYIISKDDIDFNTGIIEFFTINIKYDFIEFSIIQKTNREIVKRNEDILIDAFSSVDLEGNLITPCATSNILLKAKPIYAESQFKSIEENVNFTCVASSDNTTNYAYWSPFQVVVKSDLENTLSFLEPLSDTDGGNFRLFSAKERVSNLKITIPVIDFELSYLELFDGNGYSDFSFILKWGYDYNTSSEYHFFDYFLDISGQVINFSSGYEYTIPLLEKGQNIWLFYYQKTRLSNLTPTGGTSGTLSTHESVPDQLITISGTSTAIDSVIKGIRLIDLLRHNTNAISGLPFYSQVYDVNGLHYNNFAFNGNLIAQKDNVPFLNKFKDLMPIINEIHGDYQINSDSIEYLQYADFYRNIEIANFEEIANEENSVDYNKRYFIKQIDFEYKKSSFENTNNEKNSIDDIHTKSQWAFQSKTPDGILKIEIPQIRSAFLIDQQRTKVIKDKKVLENDDDLFLIDVVDLEPNSTNNFVTLLNHSGQKILSDGTFDWTLLGFNVGDVIYINGNNVLVLSYEERILTGSVDFGVGQSVFSITYPLSNVQFKNRTNEGFETITGIASPENYSNLNYSQKRDLENYYPKLATAGKYIPNKLIKNTAIRVNDKLETKKYSENLVIDKADIVIDDIAHLKILNPIVHTITVYCDFNQATQLFKDIETLKGYIKVNTINGKKIKGFPKEAEYEWKTEKLNLVLEEKFEGDYMDIYKLGDTIFITPIGFDTKIGLKEYNVYNNFVSLYNDKDILIANPLSFEYIKINNILYTNLIDFSNALDALI